ncbi:DM13 domain-containing protein [uncultured Roseibium sp.]|uniref:DM13 domain-containing protein n=1 Tax=uncultured Roseibium sp. TaxID=1936171 RepID=UPI002626AAA8|nr:DM13 domain-containing protein [uncultured Roseibium sp.]
MLRLILLLVSHGAVLAVGFALGVYFLPILTEPQGPDEAVLAEAAAGAQYEASLTRDLAGSDFLHWGEGTFSISPQRIVHKGELSPGPDYKLYLVKEFVEDEAGFEAVKESAVQLGDIKTFDGFIVDVPETVSIDDYNTVLVWCEAFGEFITAAKYR